MLKDNARSAKGHEQTEFGLYTQFSTRIENVTRQTYETVPMTLQRSSSAPGEYMCDLLPVAQDVPSNIPFSSNEPHAWHQSAHYGPVTIQYHPDHATGNVPVPDGMNFLAFYGTDNMSPCAQTGHSVVPQQIDSNYLHNFNGFHDASLQYAWPKASSNNNNGDPLSLGPWNDDTPMDTGAEKPTGGMNFVSQYRPMPVAPMFDNMESGMVSNFGSLPTPWVDRLSVPLTGSLPTSAAIDLSSKRSNMVYSSHPAVRNSIEQTPTESHQSPMAAPATAPVEIPPRKFKTAIGIKSRQSMNATKDSRTGKHHQTQVADGGTNVSNHPRSSVEHTFIVVSPADDSRSSLSPANVQSPSEPSNQPSKPARTPLSKDTQRERNRQAATKCREKTRNAEEDLAMIEKLASNAHTELFKTVTVLREEVFALKNQLLLHGDCNCDAIQQYLRNAARSIGEGSSPAVSHAASQGRVAAWIRPAEPLRHHSQS